jgi:hypothetical protein
VASEGAGVEDIEKDRSVSIAWEDLGSVGGCERELYELFARFELALVAESEQQSDEKEGEEERNASARRRQHLLLRSVAPRSRVQYLRGARGTRKPSTAVVDVVGLPPPRSASSLPHF